MGSHSATCHPAEVTPRLTPAEAGTRFSDPGGIQGWVDLGGDYNFQDSLPAKDGHLSQKLITRQCHDREASPRVVSQRRIVNVNEIIKIKSLMFRDFRQFYVGNRVGRP